jgi:hypothetical protein
LTAVNSKRIVPSTPASSAGREIEVSAQPVPTIKQRQLAHYLGLQRQADREAIAARRRAAQFKRRPIRDALLIMDAKLTRELGAFWPVWMLAGAFVGGASLGLLFLGIHDWMVYGLGCHP